MWESTAALQAMAKMVGVDVNAPVRVYVAEGFANVGDDELIERSACNMEGLVSFQWEEADELWLDGKLLWRSSSVRFYQLAIILVNGEAKTYTVDNNGEEITPSEVNYPLVSETNEWRWALED